MNKEKALKNQGLEFREDIIVGGVMDYMKRKNCENEYEKQVRKIIFIER